MQKRFVLLAALLALALATPASAEIEKFMSVSDGKMHPYFRLKFTPPKGWMQEKEASKKYGMAMYVQEGTDFSSSPVVSMICRVVLSCCRSVWICWR